ncbi:MAG: sigma-70 family RNA polymerase sigma factor [Pseudomonadota bacterium]
MGALLKMVDVDHDQDCQRALLLAVLQRDEVALANVIDIHLDRVVDTARRILGEASEAEDVAQETFLKFWTHPPQPCEGNAGTRIGAWLRRVAVNEAIDRLRRNSRLDEIDDDSTPAVAADQHTGLEQRDAVARLNGALERLPPRQRIAVSLFHFEELSQRDVAARLEVSEDGVESLLRRGRQNLKRALGDDIVELISDLSDGDDDEGAVT